MKPTYASIRLVEVLWRGPRQILLRYRFTDSNVEYPPGTFALFWYPGLEAIPLTPIPSNGDLLFLVVVRGDTTRRIYEKPPAYAGLIGPLGKPFDFRGYAGGKVLFIAGGAGVAAVAAVAREYAGRATLVYGARSRAEVPPLDLLFDGRVRVEYATDDGSLGFKGTAVDAALAIVGRGEGYGLAVAAGPSQMLCSLWRSGIVDVFGVERVVFAVETHVRCGLGFCGRCIVPGVGRRLCVDGMFYSLRELGEGWYSRVCGQT